MKADRNKRSVSRENPVSRPADEYRFMRAILNWVTKRGWNPSAGRNKEAIKSISSAAYHWGVSEDLIYKYLKVATHAAPTVATAFKAGELKFSSAYELCRCPLSVQEEYLFLAKRVSVRRLRQAIAEGSSELYLAATEDKQPDVMNDPNIRAFTEVMQERLGVGEKCSMYASKTHFVLEVTFTGIEKVPNIMWRLQVADCKAKIDVVTDRYDPVLKVAVGKIYVRFSQYRELMSHCSMLADNRFKGIPKADPVSFFDLDWAFRNWQPSLYGLKSSKAQASDQTLARPGKPPYSQ